MKTVAHRKLFNLTREQILRNIVQVPDVVRSRPEPLSLADLANTGLSFMCPNCGFDNFGDMVHNSIRVNDKEWDISMRCLRCPWKGRRSQLLQI